MSGQPLLKFIAGNQPLFNMEYGILSAPVRHVFMIATVWYLTQTRKDENMQILEIGSWVGASALSFAQGLKTYNNAKGTITCVDAWKPFFNREKESADYVKQMEMALSTETAYQLFSHNVGTLPETLTCQHLRGQSYDVLPLLRENTFDVIFIDGDHAYTPVLRDIKNSLALVKDGGIICGDDLNLQLSQVDAENTKKNAEADFIQDPRTKRNHHPGVTVAVAEVFGDVSMWGGFWAMQKCGDKWQKISLKDMPVVYPEHFPLDALKRAQDHFNDLVVS